MPTPRLLIVDANNLLARMAHAMLGLKSRSGLPTGGLYGAIEELKRTIVSLRHPGGVVMVFDSGVPDFRKRILPEYKEGRRKKKADKKMKQFLEEYHAQLAAAPELFQTLGMSSVKALGYEADDTAAYLVLKRFRGERLALFSGDHDWTQLVRKGTIHLVPFQGETTCIRKRDRQFLLRRSMVGDASDDVPGVPKVGPVTAQKILDAHPNARDRDPKGFLAELKVEDKNEARVLENRKSFLKSFRVMNLRRTANMIDATGKVVVTPGKFSSEAFEAQCKKFSFAQFRAMLKQTLRPFRAAWEGGSAHFLPEIADDP